MDWVMGSAAIHWLLRANLLIILTTVLPNLAMASVLSCAISLGGLIRHNPAHWEFRPARLTENEIQRIVNQFEGVDSFSPGMVLREGGRPNGEVVRVSIMDRTAPMTFLAEANFDAGRMTLSMITRDSEAGNSASFSGRDAFDYIMLKARPILFRAHWTSEMVIGDRRIESDNLRQFQEALANRRISLESLLTRRSDDRQVLAAANSTWSGRRALEWGMRARSYQVITSRDGREVLGVHVNFSAN